VTALSLNSEGPWSVPITTGNCRRMGNKRGESEQQYDFTALAFLCCYLRFQVNMSCPHFNKLFVVYCYL
jgi:hypothetical protein